MTDDLRPPSGVPARGSWPPFEDGNLAAVRHGAYSPRQVSALAAEIVERVALDAYLREPRYAAALWAWASAEARCQLLREYLDEQGPLDPKGRPRPAVDALIRFERLAGEQRQRLGLDPLSRARLGRDVTAATFDLARAMSGLDQEDRDQGDRDQGGETSGRQETTTDAD